jgi:hypothetical protein
MMTVASHGYLTKYGIPKHPHDLKQHGCIISNNDHWRFEHQTEQHNIKVQGR